MASLFQVDSIACELPRAMVGLTFYRTTSISFEYWVHHSVTAHIIIIPTRYSSHFTQPLSGQCCVPVSDMVQYLNRAIVLCAWGRICKRGARFVFCHHLLGFGVDKKESELFLQQNPCSLQLSYVL